MEVYVGGSYCTPGTSVCSGGFLADVLYAGAAPLEFAGVDQINFRIPPLNGLTGDAVQVTVASVLSPPVDGGGFSAMFGAVSSTIVVR